MKAWEVPTRRIVMYSIHKTVHQSRPCLRSRSVFEDSPNRMSSKSPKPVRKALTPMQTPEPKTASQSRWTEQTKIVQIVTFTNRCLSLTNPNSSFQLSEKTYYPLNRLLARCKCNTIRTLDFQIHSNKVVARTWETGKLEATTSSL